MAVKKEKVKKLKKNAATQVKKEIVEPAENQLRIRLVRSLIGRPREQREVAKGLGLRKMSSEVMRTNCPEVWGMIKKISHLVNVEVLEIK